MSLLSLPPELRLKIYEHVPDLQKDRLESISACSKLTPSICRVCRLIRHETIAVFASNTSFICSIDDAAQLWNERLECWMKALSPPGLARVQSLYLARHWQIPQPMRWQGHVGFYIKLERRARSIGMSKSTDSFPAAWSDRFVRSTDEGPWAVTTGTYPISKDPRSMRYESVELLASVIRSHLSNSDEEGLANDDVRFLVRSMEILASHPILTHDQDESSIRRRREIWLSMETKLNALNGRTTVTNTDACKHGSIA